VNRKLRNKHLVCAPEQGEDFQTIADDYQRFILPGSVKSDEIFGQAHFITGMTHWQHPSFFGYFSAGCTFEGMLADLYSSSTCNPGFNVRPIIPSKYTC
jgi:aromatic-L-amino-acid decarboxylase